MIGVVLAGGRSTRLGQDKVRLRLPGDGRDMLARTADLLAACTDGVVISCRAPDAGEETLALPGIRSIPDAEPGLGPLGGVWSALRELRQPILVLSCDLPFMDVPTLRRLIDARGARPPEALMTTFQQAETGFIEALVSIYEPACLPFFEEARARKYDIMPTLRRLQRCDIDTGHFYVQVTDYLSEVTKALIHITRPAFEHIDNNHEGLSKEQIVDLMRVNDQVEAIFDKINDMLSTKEFSDLDKVLEMRDQLFDTIVEAIKSQLRRIHSNPSGSTRASVLYLTILNETKTMILQSRNLLKSQHYFLEQQK